MKLLGISGSLRSGSHNTLLTREAARLFGDVEYVQADLNLPLYNGDDEDRDGLPAAVETLVAQIAEADGVIISTPEYNGGVTGVLKNALDWISRAKPQPWKDKPVAVMSAAAGRTGGILAQTMLRTCMNNFQPRIAPAAAVAIAGSGNEFGEDGQLLSDRYQASLTRLMDALRVEIERGA